MADYTGNTSLWRHISAQKEVPGTEIKKTPATATVSLEDLQRRFWQMNMARRESSFQRMQSDNTSQQELRRKIPGHQCPQEFHRPAAPPEDPIEQFSPPRRGFCVQFNATRPSSSSTSAEPLRCTPRWVRAPSEVGQGGAPDSLVLPIAE